MSARGFGGIVRSPAQPPPAAPATVTGANNGLSLAGTDVQLGGILIIPTDIDLDNFHFFINNGVNRHIELDPGANRYLFGLLDTGTNIANAISFENDTSIIYAGVLNESLKVTQSLNLYEFGDILGGNNNTRLSIDDSFQLITGLSGGGRMISLDRLNQIYQLGDVDGFGNGATLEIQDINSSLLFYDSAFASQSMNLNPIAGTYGIGDLNGIGSGNYLLVNDGTNEFTLGGPASRLDIIGDVAQITAGGVLLLSLDNPSGLFRLGDIANAGNNNKFAIDDANNLTYVQSGAGRTLNLDAGNGIYQFGDFDAVSNGNSIFVDDATNLMQYESGGGRRLYLDAGSNIYQIGDIDIVNNGARININDAAGLINFDNAASNVGLVINGVAGFTGTVAAPASITVNGGIVTNVT